MNGLNPNTKVKLPENKLPALEKMRFVHILGFRSKKTYRKEKAMGRYTIISYLPTYPRANRQVPTLSNTKFAPNPYSLDSSAWNRIRMRNTDLNSGYNKKIQKDAIFADRNTTEQLLICVTHKKLKIPKIKVNNLP